MTLLIALMLIHGLGLSSWLYPLVLIVWGIRTILAGLS